MRLRKLSLKGITRFAGETEIDFEGLGEGLIAIAGRNGEGKTTILEAPFAALYLECPTRPGGLYGVAHGRDAKLEVLVDECRALVAVDAVRQTTEAYLFGRDGRPLTPTGKVRDYTAAVVERFGSARLMLSAALSCQTKRGSFLDLTKAERKDLLAEILDTAGLQALSESARERAKATELALERARGALAAGERELAAMPVHDYEALKQAVTAAVNELASLRGRLEAARERYATLEAERRQIAERVAGVRRLREQRDEASRALNLIEQRLAKLDEEEVAAESAIGERRKQLEAQAARLQELEEAERDLAASRDAVADCDAAVARARAAANEARNEHVRLQRESDRAESITLRLQSAQRQAELLGRVPCAEAEEWIAADSRAAVNLSRVCPLLESAHKASLTVGELAEESQALILLPEQLAAAGERWRRAEEEVEGVVKALEEARSRERALAAVAGQADAARLAVSQLEALAEEANRGREARAKRREDLLLERNDATERCQRLEQEVAATPMPDAGQVEDALAKAAEEGRALRAAVDAAQQALSAAERRLAGAEADIGRRGILERQLSETRGEMLVLGMASADWRTLERAFGRDGIQALEIDAAGPELSSLTNELLTSCFGPRFDITFVTQALRADGRGAKEVFDVQVMDHDRGREGAIDSLSGGEKTILSEAISLALAIYVGRHSGRRFATLYRDETAGQLDPDNAQRYVAMLRRARVLAGAYQVIYIAQQPEVWSQADAVLWCDGGRVEVRQ